MRNALIRFALWLAQRLGLTLIDRTALLASTDAMQRSQQWEAFYRETGGLRDMLNAIRQEAFEAAAELDPAETAKIYYWATADRNIRKLQNRIEAVIASGKVEAARLNSLARAEQARILR